MTSITQHDDWRMQRIALHALDEITQAHKALPVVPWTLTGGLRLYADISPYADAPVATYEAWRDALGLDGEKTVRDTAAERRWCSGEWKTERGGHTVKLVLHVTVDLPEDEAVSS